ncbi:WAT1-related protein At4g08300-like [Neltuma alba]|uniref:WAT1-related protein At4g08300-like n=1 Tax=Neltuma alba TaxID=207710 RepID=UPI0010A3BDBB|nr:WAT1-related protein At4g08300-like [Prosopis alba]XP_028787916.1 WAT1-related protein At4g08300-like [Prosopis alba]
MGMSEVMRKVKPYLAIISLQFGYSGMYVITMVSFKHGMSHWVLSVYRHVVALLIIAPFALVLERKIRPKMTLPIFLRMVALGFLEPVLDQNLYNMGMKATSTTFASAIVNVLPAITFLMALIFRLESVNLKKLPSWAKIIGTVITVSGAMVMTLYKGKAFQIIKAGGISHHDTASTEPSDQHWVLGTVYLIGSCCGWAGFFILQSFTLKMYPAELSLTAWICATGIVEGSIATFIMERDLSVWVIGWDSRLLACVYSGVVCSGMAYYVQGVVTKERGPVFLTSFSPLIMIITAALGSFVLAEQVHVGSIIGAILIVFGLYSVVWGKSKDIQSTSDDTVKGEGHELPIKDGTRSGSDIFDKIEVSVPAEKSKGPGKNINVPQTAPPPRS